MTNVAVSVERVERLGVLADWFQTVLDTDLTKPENLAAFRKNLPGVIRELRLIGMPSNDVLEIEASLEEVNAPAS